MSQNSQQDKFMPLARRMRPTCLDEFIGQSHLLKPGKPLFQAIRQSHLHSMILWGPPGTGKTSLAYLLAASSHARVEALSAVLAGVKDIRKIVERAEAAQDDDQATVLFVDEVHRFNKAQQDAFLPHVEQGTIILIGATTENPSFQLNNALLSRARVYLLKPLTEDELVQVIQQALADHERGYGQSKLTMSAALQFRLAKMADGDARQCLNLLEIMVDFTEDHVIDDDVFAQVVSSNLRRFDQQGEYFYDQISALHKSVRGSDPDAALYWFTRMIDGGCDPLYIARRVLRMATEDIGNADPRALQLALQAWQTYERLGSPEGELALAQAVVFCACAAKSNATYLAYQAAMKDVTTFGSLEVPLELRNAPTSLMKQCGYGKGYRYAHDEQEAFAAGVEYLPTELQGHRYYYPVNRGLEIQIAEKLKTLRLKNQQAHQSKNSETDHDSD